MGDYKGRRNLRKRKKRFAKDQRIKALATAEKSTTPLSGVADGLPSFTKPVPGNPRNPGRPFGR